MAASGPAEHEDSLSRSDLRDAALRGARWVTIGRLVVETAAFAGTIVVARNVSPAEFGFAAVAAFVYALAMGLPAASFGSPLVQAKELRATAVRATLALSILSGAVVTLAVVVGVQFAEGPLPARAVDLVQLVAPAFLLYSIGAPSQALLQRSLDFRRIAINEMTALVPGTAVTVACAVAGLGGASIVLGFLTVSAVSTAQAVFWRPPGRPAWHPSELRELVRFGLAASASGLLYTAQRNVQLAVLGARLEPSAVGFFWRGSQLAVDYQGKISGILLRVLFPILSRAREAEDMRAVRERMVKLHTATIFPLLTSLVVLAPVLIPFLYGERWSGAIPVAQILAVGGAVAAVGTGTGPLMMAVGRPDALAKYGVVSLLVFVVVVVVASGHGLITVCVAMAVFRLCSLVGTQYILVQRYVGIPLRDTLVRDIAPAAVSCVALAAVCWPAAEGLRAVGAPAPVVLVCAGSVGLLAYAVVLRSCFSGTWRDLSTLARRIGPSGSRSRASDGAPSPAASASPR